MSEAQTDDKARDAAINLRIVEAAADRAAEMGRGAVVAACSPGRTGKQRHHLRGLGHHIKPVVTIGHQGLTPGVRDSIDKALDQHELIKVKALESAPHDVKTTALWIHNTTEAQVVQIVGRVALAYRPRDKKPLIKLP